MKESKRKVWPSNIYHEPQLRFVLASLLFQMSLFPFLMPTHQQSSLHYCHSFPHNFLVSVISYALFLSASPNQKNFQSVWVRRVQLLLSLTTCIFLFVSISSLTSLNTHTDFFPSLFFSHLFFPQITYPPYSDIDSNLALDHSHTLHT